MFIISIKKIKFEAHLSTKSTQWIFHENNLKKIILMKPQYSFKKRLNNRKSSEYKYSNLDMTI